MFATTTSSRYLQTDMVVTPAYSAASDFLLALIPWTLLIGLQMKKPEKIGVGVAMSMGFLYVQSILIRPF